MSTILGPQENESTTFAAAAEKTSTLLSSSPAETPGRKRTRAALRAMSLNDGSPEKKDLSARKPVRKVSRASSSGGGSKKGTSGKDVGDSDVEIIVDAKPAVPVAGEEDKENQMVLDV